MKISQTYRPVLVATHTINSSRLVLHFYDSASSKEVAREFCDFKQISERSIQLSLGLVSRCHRLCILSLRNPSRVDAKRGEHFHKPTHVTEGTKPCRLSARQEKYRRWSHRRKYLQCQLLLRAGTNAQFDKPFFDIGADHVRMVFL